MYPNLVDTWRLNDQEKVLVNRQQGTACAICHSKQRAQALAHAVCRCYGFTGPLRLLPRHRPRLRILAINDPAELARDFALWRRFTLAEYPAVDMQRLPYADQAWDLVVHSDTLEHVLDPILGLSECLRVLKPGGWLIYTVPMLPHRPTRRRGPTEPASYHGTREVHEWPVISEYGGDAWREPIAAGFEEVRIVCWENPSAFAICARRPVEPRRWRRR